MRMDGTKCTVYDERDRDRESQGCAKACSSKNDRKKNDQREGQSKRACDGFLDTNVDKSSWCEPNLLRADAAAIRHISYRCLSFPLNKANIFIHVCRPVVTYPDTQTELLNSSGCC